MIQEHIMNAHPVTLAGEKLLARPDGSLHWPARSMLVVSDLHLGKSERMARRGGALLPPYETHETLWRLDSAIEQTRPATVLCLGDSFDDLDAALSLPEEARLRLARFQAGRDWIWIEGNHDPGPVELGGTHRYELALGGLVFRHIATAATGEVSGHFHPKLSLPGQPGSRPCFLVDNDRLILPAFGAYTGGLRANAPPLVELMAPDALAILTGRRATPVPLAACLRGPGTRPRRG